MPRKSAAVWAPPISAPIDDQQAGEGRQQDRRPQGRAPGGLLGGGHRVSGSLVELPCRKVFRPDARSGHRWQPLFAPMRPARPPLGCDRDDRRRSSCSPSRSSSASRPALRPDLRRRFAPLESLIEEMEKVDLSRPGLEPAALDRRDRRDRGGRADRARLPADDAAPRGRTAARRHRPRCAPRRRSGPGSPATSTTRSTSR